MVGAVVEVGKGLATPGEDCPVRRLTHRRIVAASRPSAESSRCDPRHIRVHTGMRLLRGLAGALLWIVSGLVGLVAVILCVTIILLPVGLPLLGYARRLFTLSLKMILPRVVTHPVETADKAMQKRGRKARRQVAAAAPDTKKLRKRTGKKARKIRDKVPLAS
jgi:hypothetical protein